MFKRVQYFKLNIICRQKLRLLRYLSVLLLSSIPYQQQSVVLLNQIDAHNRVSYTTLYTSRLELLERTPINEVRSIHREKRYLTSHMFILVFQLLCKYMPHLQQGF